MSTVRSRLRAVVVGVTLLALLAGGAGTAAGVEPEEALRDVRGRLDGARRDLAEVEGRKAVTIEDLERVDAVRAELEEQLAALEGELEQAEQALAAAEDRLARTTHHLRLTRAALTHTRGLLVQQREDFEERVRASYKYGGTDPSAIAVEVTDVNEFGRALTYVNTILDRDRRRVDTMASLEQQVQEQTRAIERLQHDQQLAAAAAEEERNAVAALVERHEGLKAQADAEAERHHAILAQLEADANAQRQLIASLESESARLEAELRARAEAARRAAEAAERERREREAATRRSGRSAPLPANGILQRPVDATIGSRFGWRVHPIAGSRRMHAGVDFPAPQGTPIVAAADGVVVSAGRRGGYGNATVIDHGDGVATLYGHQSRIFVRTGDEVKRGERIGAVGSTGYSTGPHLHFEVRVNGVPRDPVDYL